MIHRTAIHSGKLICWVTLVLLLRGIALSADVTKEESFFLFDVTLPIVQENAKNLVKKLEERITPKETHEQKITVIFRMSVPTGQENFGRGSSFGSSFEVANLISGPKFIGVKTAAYFPQSVKGHAILVALACDEILLAPDAEIGLAGVDEPQLNDTIFQAYREMAGRRSRVAPAIVRKMLDPKTELLQVESEHGLHWITTDELADFRARETLVGEPTVISPAGQPGLFTADQARKIGLASGLVENLAMVMVLYKTVPSKLQHVTVRGDRGRAIRIDLNGAVTEHKTSEVQRSITRAILGGDGSLAADFVCLWIDSPGGNLSASLKLAAFLTHDIEPTKTRVVAYIPVQARSDAALVAAACDEIVLGPRAILGGDGASTFRSEQIADAVETLATSFSKKSRRNWSLWAAMIDSNLEVHRYSLADNPNTLGFFSQKEWNAQPNPEQWIQGELLTKPGTVFSVTGSRAVELWLADKIADNFEDFKKLYHLEDDPTLVKPGWADQFVRALASPSFAALLIFVGFIGIMVELKTPGIGLGAVVAVICFALFFWSRYLGGTAGWLEIILLVTGLVFILLEIFVIPGFGAFGIIGGLCVIVSIVLASQTFVIPHNSYQYGQLINSGVVLVISGIGMIFVAAAGARWVHDLNKPKDLELIRETEKLADYEHLRGRFGETTTLLVPSGRAMIDGQLVDVTSDGDMIPAKTRIAVTDVRGYKIIVKKQD